jgi:UDP-N-acetylglucosamine 3-dehydrogenase
MKRVRVAVIGVGGWGKNLVRVFHDLDGCKLVAICDKNPTRAKEIGELYSVPYFIESSSVLGRNGVDAVAIATPSSTHFELAIQSIRMGKHTFVEKPLCSFPEEGRKLVKEAEAREVKLMVGHIERYNPAIQELKKLMEESDLGKIFSLIARRVGRPVKIGKIGVIKDLAIHDIDLMRYLLNQDPISVFATCKSVEDVRFEDLAEITLTFKDGIVGYVEANRLPLRKERTLCVVSERAWVVVDYLNKSLTITNSLGKREVPVGKEEPLKVELSHFIDCILNDEEPLTSGLEGLRSLEVAEEALRSFREGEPVLITYA